MTAQSQKGKEIIETIKSYKTAKSNLETALGEYKSQKEKLIEIGLEAREDESLDKLDSDDYFANATRKLEHFSHFEERWSAVFAPKSIISGSSRCALKLYRNGDIAIGCLRRDDTFKPMPMDECHLSPSEVLWYVDVINWTRKYNSMLKK